MRKIWSIRIVVLVVLLWAGSALAADVKAPAKTAGDNVKADAKAPAAGKENTKGKGADAKAAATAKAKIVDINSATDSELRGVPGIGDAFAAKIIAGRPYANKTQLKSRKILPVTLYEQVKDKLIAKQPQK